MFVEVSAPRPGVVAELVGALEVDARRHSTEAHVLDQPATRLGIVDQHEVDERPNVLEVRVRDGDPVDSPEARRELAAVPSSVLEKVSAIAS